jgi:uncharacterized protein YyaL (SSP411 family)
MIRTIVISCLCVAVGPSALAQGTPDKYSARIAAIEQNIQTHFYESTSGLFTETDSRLTQKKPHSYLWPLCALVQAVNETRATKAPDMREALGAIGQYYSPIDPAPAYQSYVMREEAASRFYDDNEWIAIACMDAYDRTKKEQYLQISKVIYRFLMTGYDSLGGGGLYWEEDKKKSKNTCSNGPGILVALALYKATKDKAYLDTALSLYHWTNRHLQAPDGLYYDAIRIPSLKIDSARYTYNTGTMLQSNVLLYTLTGDAAYLTEAKRIADAAQRYFYRRGKLPGNYWFNVVLLRGYIALYEIEKDPARLSFIVADGDRIWEQERDASNLLGPGPVKSLIDQAAMLEMYARLRNLGLTR